MSSETIGKKFRPRSGGRPIHSVTSGRRYFYRVPYCVPYWTASTYGAIGRSLLTARVLEGSAIESLEADLRQRFGASDAVACYSGRVALELALAGVGIGEGDEVVVPAFCCKSIVEPIVRLRATPVFADVGEDLNVNRQTVEAALTERSRAVVVAHLFGNPSDIGAIETYCRERGLSVVDDAAQAVGASYRGRSVGSFGDAGVISFGRGKVCFGTGGGAWLAGNGTGTNQGARRVSLRPETRNVTEMRKALDVILWRVWRRWTLPVAAALRRAGIWRERPVEYLSAPITNLDAAVALSLLGNLRDNIEKRRERVRMYHERLHDCEHLHLIPHGAGSACLTQAVVVAPGRSGTEDADRLLGSLRRSGFEVNRSYRPLHLMPSCRNYPRASSLRTVEAIDGKVLELPCEPSVKLRDVERICNIVRDSVSSGARR